MSYFWSPNKGWLMGRRGVERRRKGRKREIKQRYGSLEFEYGIV